MGRRIEKLKTHFRENKQVYLACGGTAVVAVIGTLVVVKRPPAPGPVNALVYNGGASYKPQNHNKIVFKVDALGDPGNVVRDKTTGNYYPSQGAAARALDVPPQRVSEHLHGKSPHVMGHELEIVGKAGNVDVIPSR